MPGLQHLPAWGPSDQMIYFSSGEPHSGMQDIWRAPASGAGPEPVVFGAHFNIEVSVNSSGDLAVSSNRSGRYDLWIYRSEGPAERLVAASERISTPAWSPDGAEILFASSKGGMFDLWRVRASEGEPIRLTSSDRGARGPAWYSAPVRSDQP